MLFTACERSCLEKRPKDVKRIDWENYNDVYTAFWNTHVTCNDFYNIYLNRNIMVYGWIRPQFLEDGFTLFTGNNNDKSYPLIGQPHFDVHYWCPMALLIREKLDSCDLSKKCYVKGKLVNNGINLGSCCVAIPMILIEDIDDFYFE